MVAYLRKYSGTLEEKSKSSQEKNPELPTEIRRPEECFEMIKKGDEKKDAKTIQIMFSFLHQFTQNIIVDTNDVDSKIKSW